MKNLSQVKKAMTLGSRWHGYYHGQSNRNIPPRDLGIREIVIVQTNAIAFQSMAGERWLWWPKAKDIRCHEDGNGFDVLENGTVLLTYKKAV